MSKELTAMTSTPLAEYVKRLARRYHGTIEQQNGLRVRLSFAIRHQAQAAYFDAVDAGYDAIASLKRAGTPGAHELTIYTKD